MPSNIAIQNGISGTKYVCICVLQEEAENQTTCYL